MLLFLSGCGSATLAPSTLRIRSSGEVAACESVGVIEERIETAGEIEALKARVRATVRDRAIKLQASDLVILKEENEMNYAYAKAEAFRCRD